jgi:hypothetical protein
LPTIGTWRWEKPLITFDVGLLEFGLIMQISEGIDLFTIGIVDEFEPEFEVIHCM